MATRILIVEDDPTLRTGLRDAFAHEGWEVTVAQDGLIADELLYSRHFSAVVLDIMLPGRGGLEVLRDLRATGIMTPVLLLTARSDENDKVLGLELGADDYVTKPFGLRELLARVRVLLRREQSVLDRLSEKAPAVVHFTIGTAEVDLETFLVRRGNEVAPITPKEAAMLALLHQEAGRVVSRLRFMEEIWEGGETVTNRTIDTHVLNLRRKLEDDPKHPRHLVTVHGAGYRLCLTDS